MSRTPGIERARNDVASEAAAGYRPVDLVVIEQPFAHHQKVVIAPCPIDAACAAPKKNDGAGMQSFDETVYRFRESLASFIDRCCIGSIYRPRGRNPTKT
jgi:hypothetical protein